MSVDFTGISILAANALLRKSENEKINPKQFKEQDKVWEKVRGLFADSELVNLNLLEESSNDTEAHNKLLERIEDYLRRNPEAAQQLEELIKNDSISQSKLEDSYYRLNNDLARKILFYLHNSSSSSHTGNVVIEGFSEEEISYQIKLLAEDSYVVAHDASTLGKMKWLAVSLTGRGLNLWNLIEDEAVWSKIKESANGRELSFQEIHSLAREFYKKLKDAEPSKKITKQAQKKIKANPKPTSKEPNAESSKVSEANLPADSDLDLPSPETNETTDLSVELTPPVILEDYLPTVQMSNVGDQPTVEDKLGFKPYVEAIAQFLTDEKTKGPFTLSIEGEWGSGKSSFMLQLEEALEKLDSNILTVHFNAWRYDKEDALWAAFATRVVKELSEKVEWWQRWKAKYKLFRCRYDLKKGWFSLLSLILVGVSLFVLAVTIINRYIINPQSITPDAGQLQGIPEKDGISILIKFLTFSAVGYIILYLLALRKLNEFLINPLAADFKKNIKTPDYSRRATFLDEFHDDFNKIIKS